MIERQANAHASQTMMVLLAKELFAQINAARLVYALLKNNSQPKLTVYILPLGMLKSMSDAYAISEDEAQTVHYLNAHQVLMY